MLSDMPPKSTPTHTPTRMHARTHSQTISLNEAWWFVVCDCRGVVLITGVSVPWHKLGLF